MEKKYSILGSNLDGTITQVYGNLSKSDIRTFKRERKEAAIRMGNYDSLSQIIVTSPGDDHYVYDKSDFFNKTYYELDNLIGDSGYMMLYIVKQI
jgi:hypothetical protein